MTKIFGLLISCFFMIPSLAQERKVVRGKFFYNGLPYLKELNGRLGGNNFRSDSNGEFKKIYYSSGQKGVSMTINGGWEVMFPDGSFFPFTTDSSHVWKVHIKKVNETSAIQMLIKKVDAFMKNRIEADKFTIELNKFKKEYLNKIDDKIIEGIEQQAFLLEKIRIENEKRDSLVKMERDAVVRAGKKKILNLFSSDMNHFITRALDVEDAFRLKGNKIFKDRQTQVEVAKRILAYSEAYEQLNKDRALLLNGVEEYWEDEFRIIEAQSLLDYALDNLHKLTMLTSNELIRDINCIATQKEKKCPRKKETLKSDAERFNRELHYKIDILKDKKDRVLQKLKYKGKK